MNDYCYHSPWCEPGERCGCAKYAEFEAREKQQQTESANGRNITSDKQVNNEAA